MSDMNSLDHILQAHAEDAVVERGFSSADPMMDHDIEFARNQALIAEDTVGLLEYLASNDVIACLGATPIEKLVTVKEFVADSSPEADALLEEWLKDHQNERV